MEKDSPELPERSEIKPGSKTRKRIELPPKKLVSGSLVEVAMEKAAYKQYMRNHLSKFENDLIGNLATKAARSRRRSLIEKRSERPFPESLAYSEVADDYDDSNLAELLYENYPTQLVDEDLLEGLLDPIIEEISVLVLCHGGIIMNIYPQDKYADLNKEPEEVLNSLLPEYLGETVAPSAVKHHLDFRSYFSFSFDTVEYKGIYTNVTSCAGMPNMKLPFPSVEDQKYVNSEELAMKRSEKNEDNLPIKKIWALCSDNSLSEIDFSASFCDSQSTVSKKCFNLIKHTETLCDSLIIKHYSCKIEEVSKFDCGKIIMFIKVKDADGEIFVKKIVLLGPEMHESLDNLNIMFSGAFEEAIETYLGSCVTNETELKTNTYEIVRLINSLVEPSIPVRFFDKSCNTVSNLNGGFEIPKYKNIRPNTPLFVMFSLINSQISAMQQCKISVFGGRRAKRISRRKHKFYKN